MKEIIIINPQCGPIVTKQLQLNFLSEAGVLCFEYFAKFEKDVRKHQERHGEIHCRFTENAIEVELDCTCWRQTLTGEAKRKCTCKEVKGLRSRLNNLVSILGRKEQSRYVMS